MVKVTERSTGSPFYIEKVDGEEKYCIYDASTGEKVSDDAEFSTRREAAAELKKMLDPEYQAKKKKEIEDEDSDEEDDDDEGDHEYR